MQSPDWSEEQNVCTWSCFYKNISCGKSLAFSSWALYVWREMERSEKFKHTETLSNTSFLSRFKCFENHTSKHLGGGTMWIGVGCLGQPWYGNDRGVAGLAWIVSDFFITHIGKLQQNQDSLHKREPQTTIHCSCGSKSLILWPWGWVAESSPAQQCCRPMGTLRWVFIIAVNLVF